jgi:hypothetical protein
MNKSRPLAFRCTPRITTGLRNETLEVTYPNHKYATTKPYSNIDILAFEVFSELPENDVSFPLCGVVMKFRMKYVWVHDF